MRTTITLDQDLYDIACAIARDQRRSLSAVINELLRNGLSAVGERRPRTARAQFPSFRSRRKVTLEDVHSLEDQM